MFPDCIESNRSHLILSTHHQILRQQNHSISDDFVSKWQYAPKQGAKEVPYKLKFGLSCLLETIITLSILLQALSSIYSIALPFFLFHARLRVGRAEEKSP
ncbi:hypothetical protein NC651_017102 [Populus alba x Populus x berolinensis]|nr:hypothetical protein NC651_017102 [Populus alba x Populus x berolinensis]